MMLRAALALCLLASPLLAQEPENDPRSVQPERPTVATHAHTVAPGYFEIEAGVQGDRISAGQRAYFAPVVTKVGLASHLQLNVTTPGVFSAAGQQAGLGDLSLGLKWRILDDHEFLGDVAILPTVKFPTGYVSKGTGSGSTDLSLTVISSHEFGGVSMDVNAIYTRLGSVSGAGARDAWNAALCTLSFGFPIAGKLSWAAEVFGQPTIDGSGAPYTAAILFGPTYLVATSLNLDLGIITPFHGDMPNSVYAGFVWNLGSPFAHPKDAKRLIAR